LSGHCSYSLRDRNTRSRPTRNPPCQGDELPVKRYSKHVCFAEARQGVQGEDVSHCSLQSTCCHRHLRDRSTREHGAFALPICAASPLPLARHACVEGDMTSATPTPDRLAAHRPLVASRFGPAALAESSPAPLPHREGCLAAKPIRGVVSLWID